MAAGYEVPKAMFIHGYLLMEGHKMSKSLGNVLDPFEVIERFGADALRYYCFREVSFGQDGSVSAAGFEARYDSELANEYGNLASRTLAMIDRFRDGRVPAADPDPDLVSGPGGLAGVEGAVCELLDRAELTQALEEIWKRVRRLNRYVEETRPWDLAKDDGEADRLDQVLYNLAEGLRVTTVLLSAYMPETGERMLDALGAESREITAFGSHGGEQSIEKLPPLFPKIETAAA
jgi:methionyl-tRNA synthetase